MIFCAKQFFLMEKRKSRTDGTYYRDSPLTWVSFNKAVMWGCKSKKEFSVLFSDCKDYTVKTRGIKNDLFSCPSYHTSMMSSILKRIHRTASLDHRIKILINKENRWINVSTYRDLMAYLTYKKTLQFIMKERVFRDINHIYKNYFTRICGACNWLAMQK